MVINLPSPSPQRKARRSRLTITQKKQIIDRGLNVEYLRIIRCYHSDVLFFTDFIRFTFKSLMTAYKDENPNASYSDLSQAAFVLFGVPLSRSAAHQILKTRDIIEKVPKNHAHLVRRRLGFENFED